MLIAATTLIVSSLSSDAKKQSFLESYVSSTPANVECLYKKSEPFVKTYFLKNSSSQVKQQQIIKELEISNKIVKRNALDIIHNLPELFLINFDVDNIYESSYGTAILEYETKSSNFTIEIGEDSFGYFGEKDGDYLIIEEEVFIPEERNERNKIFGKLSKEFVKFYN
ncbi:hypothetical protein CGC58_09900 [Capnocytophaga stomatis]|uniref:Uncharacterized protein n=1 Tax=Capnocytophaga stomatis TaxID=1848904 RepID=A0A250FZV7_9FLAO|nr:hypothetical protein [Capnocytophaga stomatis]ATA90005.1 hypothetical protein CGC58_09900 [Capnocytophaga stomatis]